MSNHQKIGTLLGLIVNKSQPKYRGRQIKLQALRRDHNIGKPFLHTLSGVVSSLLLYSKETVESRNGCGLVSGNSNGNWPLILNDSGTTITVNIDHVDLTALNCLMQTAAMRIPITVYVVHHQLIFGRGIYGIVYSANTKSLITLYSFNQTKWHQEKVRVGMAFTDKYLQPQVHAVTTSDKDTHSSSLSMFGSCEDKKLPSKIPPPPPTTTSSSSSSSSSLQSTTRGSGEFMTMVYYHDVPASQLQPSFSSDELANSVHAPYSIAVTRIVDDMNGNSGTEVKNQHSDSEYGGWFHPPISVFTENDCKYRGVSVTPSFVAKVHHCQIQNDRGKSGLRAKMVNSCDSGIVSSILINVEDGQNVVDSGTHITFKVCNNSSVSSQQTQTSDNFVSSSSSSITTIPKKQHQQQHQYVPQQYFSNTMKKSKTYALSDLSYMQALGLPIRIFTMQSNDAFLYDRGLYIIVEPIVTGSNMVTIKRINMDNWCQYRYRIISQYYNYAYAHSTTITIPEPIDTRPQRLRFGTNTNNNNLSPVISYQRKQQQQPPPQYRPQQFNSEFSQLQMPIPMQMPIRMPMQIPIPITTTSISQQPQFPLYYSGNQFVSGNNIPIIQYAPVSQQH